MPVAVPDIRLKPRAPSWRWWVCCLLLMATMINYMDRLTLNLLAPTIVGDLGLDKRDYGSIEMGFALAFAFGAIVFGFIVDRWNVFWVYPLGVLAWSAAGFCTGFADGFLTLLLCRVLLGAAESANWPCALRTTQKILPPGDRAMGNSILQSGAAIGAIIIPLVMLALFDERRPGTWRLPFLVVGAFGASWVILWWASVRRSDLALAHQAPLGSLEARHAPVPLPRRVFLRRFFVLMVMVVTINMTWHFLRAWGPFYLQEQRGFSAKDTFRFFMVYYLFTDAGALAAGFVALRLARGGMAVHASRWLVFLAGALMAGVCVLLPILPGGWVLVGGFLVIGFGSLGVFPIYYSFTQDLTVRNQGKVTGVLGCFCWIAMAIWQKGISEVVASTGSYTPAFIIAGLAPLLGFTALVLFWGPTDEPAQAPIRLPDFAEEPPRVAASDERITVRDEAIADAAAIEAPG
jgi:MFS transporter, ACS family, hexuronate transporter